MCVRGFTSSANYDGERERIKTKTINPRVRPRYENAYLHSRDHNKMAYPPEQHDIHTPRVKLPRKGANVDYAKRREGEKRDHV